MSMLCLKSNMDRFIVFVGDYVRGKKICLKSNMDRFIGNFSRRKSFRRFCLKSNMDRFIAANKLVFGNKVSEFKIQYG